MATSLNGIKVMAKAYDNARADVESLLIDYSKELERVKRKRIAALKAAVGRTVQLRSNLAAAARGTPALAKGRARSFGGVTIACLDGKVSIETRKSRAEASLMRRLLDDAPSPAKAA